MTGIEMPDELDANRDLLGPSRSDSRRRQSAHGYRRTIAEAASKPSIPKIAMVTGPREAGRSPAIESQRTPPI